MIDFLLAGVAVIFRMMCLFAKETVWEIIVSINPSEKTSSGMPDAWRTNLNMLGGVSLILSTLLLFAL